MKIEFTYIVYINLLIMPNAYVTLCMGQHHYIKGALAMAFSLRKTNTKHIIVCMITPDLSRYKNILGVIFDKVIIVPYLKYETNPLKTKKQNEIYESWKDISFTKWNCLDLQYDKVCLLDADLIIQKNIDHLFKLDAPSGCWGNNWSSCVNYYNDIKYGEIINNDQIHKGIKNGYLVNGHCIILEPSKKLYNDFIDFMKSKQYIKPHLCLAMTDEYALVQFMLQKNKVWHQIDMRYNCVPWKNDIHKSFILHFFNKPKCWQMEKIEWGDLQIWWDIWDELSKKHPEIKQLNKLK
jgi:lipopolysaccharide biosynthesis glycosyltransferase